MPATSSRAAAEPIYACFARLLESPAMDERSQRLGGPGRQARMTSLEADMVDFRQVADIRTGALPV